MDSLNYASKLYVDSYAEDLFGHGSRGCAYVDLTELEGRNLAKDIDMRNVSCKSNFTLVKVVKFKEQYYYKSYIGCGPKKGATVEPDVFKPSKVERSELCNGEFDKTVLINADPATVTDATNQDVSPIITLSSETGVNRTTDLKYGWSYAEGDHNIIGGEGAWQNLSFNIPTKRSQIKMIQRSETQTFASKTNVESPNVTGDVWLVIKVTFLEDLDGVNWQTVNNEEDNYVYIGPFRLDNSPPEITNVTVASSDPNFQHQKADVSFTAVDHQYTEQNNLKVCIVANRECKESDYKPFRDSDTIKVANDYDGGTYQVYIGVKDEAGNTTELPPVSYQVYRRCSVAIPKENWRDITQCTKKCTLQ